MENANTLNQIDLYVEQSMDAIIFVALFLSGFDFYHTAYFDGWIDSYFWLVKVYN